MKTIEWKKYFIELVVVFISITAAFLLNSWRENSNSNDLEIKYLNSLKNDIIQDSISVEEVYLRSEKKLSKFDNYINANSHSELPLDSSFVLLKEILSISTFKPVVNTYESMKNSGNFNLISSYDLREQITNYYESFGNITFQQRITLQFINDYVTKFAIENLNILEFTILENKEIKKPEVDNLIFTYYAFLTQNIKFQKDVAINNKKILKYLNSYL